ncbi:MAG TPA: tetraacyldisaccharide 4'-kinase [Ohtaekwangia sp.]|nr:tetraacyldisaccharide 4'-kinase [Ohtaekwangia sp.]
MILRILLFPFALLYHLVSWARNQMYDVGLKPSASFEIPVISIGNLSVGGTGKTPMVEYIIQVLESDFSIGTLSRGYKRTTKGFRIAAADDNALTIGDEPYQFYKKHHNEITVAVGEDRAMAIPALLQEHDLDVILLDDAFQHRKVRPSFNVLLTDFNKPFFTDFILPSGRLRESRSGAKRADVVIVTKCPPTLTVEKQADIERAIRRYTTKPVFFTTIAYGSPVSFGEMNGGITDEIILLSGIADPTTLLAYARQHFKVLEHLHFPDHYQYKSRDIKKLREKFTGSNPVSILTTEKDMVKLDAEEFKQHTMGIPLFYLPISVGFLKSGQDFDEMLLRHVRQHREKN